MAAKSKKMYANAPKVERDEKGNLGVVEPTKADAVQSGTDGVAIKVKQASDRAEAVHRHVSEYLSMHHRHEAAYASGGDGAAHLEELTAMHKRHASEMKEMQKRHAKGGIETKSDSATPAKEEKTITAKDGGVKE